MPETYLPDTLADGLLDDAGRLPEARELLAALGRATAGEGAPRIAVRGLNGSARALLAAWPSDAAPRTPALPRPHPQLPSPDGASPRVRPDALMAALQSAVVDGGDAVVLADRLVVLADGAVVEEGPTAEVLARPRSAFAARIAGLDLVGGAASAAGVPGCASSSAAVSEPCVVCGTPCQTSASAVTIASGTKM